MQASDKKFRVLSIYRSLLTQSGRGSRCRQQNGQVSIFCCHGNLGRLLPACSRLSEKKQAANWQDWLIAACYMLLLSYFYSLSEFDDTNYSLNCRSLGIWRRRLDPTVLYFTPRLICRGLRDFLEQIIWVYCIDVKSLHLQKRIWYSWKRSWPKRCPV